MVARVACVLAALVLVGFTVTAVAQDWPPLKHGMWEIVRTMQPPGGGTPKVLASKRCMTPAEDWKRQNEKMAQAGCTFSPVKRTGGSYTFTASCRVMGTSSNTTTTIVPDGDSAFTLTVEGTADGARTKEVMKGTRAGECTK
jgi:hypothetical protein